MMIQSPWARSSSDVLQAIQSNDQTGLSKESVVDRLAHFGPNTLKAEKKTSWHQRLLRQFQSPVVITLLVATVISFAIGEWVDSIAILSIVVLNAMIGYIQEAKAEAAVEALKQLSAPGARVLRNSKVVEVPASEVCIGDILILEAGDYVPADARILVANQLTVEEAVLTGESLPISKYETIVPEDAPIGDRLNMLFSGTAIATGSGRAVITATGMRSEIGKIAGMLGESEDKQTPLQLRLAQVNKRLLVFAGGVVIVIAALGALRGNSWIEIIMTSVGLAVAAIPEGLPTVVTLALALAIRRMVKRKAIVRHLMAVETLGSTDIICTDKTGTLTTGKMRVREVVWGGEIFDVSDKALAEKKCFWQLMEASVLCSNASLGEDDQSTGDPTEVALLYLARDYGVDAEKLSASHLRVKEWSFDSVRKRMSVAVEDHGKQILYLKGAPESVLEICNLSDHNYEREHRAMEQLSSKGRRLLAVAWKELHLTKDAIRIEISEDPSEVEKDLTFLGIISIADPPRPESISAIQECKAAGIKVAMTTGDHPITAKAIATELGIVELGHFEGVLTGPELETMPLSELESKVEQTAVYARVSPEHKLKIVRAWKNKGKIVAMTGDGVNDAPALKEASIGISMGKGGTEVARQASSIILTDDNFATIVSAVEEGRAIYGNIRRTIQYLLSGNLAEILIMLGAAVAMWPTPLAAIHLLWINLVTDGLPALALAAEPLPNKVLEEIKRPSPNTFFDRSFYREMAFIGVITTVMALGVYGYSLSRFDELTARTYVFSFLVFAELFRSFACRSDTKTFFQMGFFSNIYHLIAVAIPVFFQIVLHHSSIFQEVFKVKPIGMMECLILFILPLIPVTAIELRKVVRQNLKKKEGNRVQ